MDTYIIANNHYCVNLVLNGYKRLTIIIKRLYLIKPKAIHILPIAGIKNHSNFLA